jgi:hypothetical protein
LVLNNKSAMKKILIVFVLTPFLIIRAYSQEPAQQVDTLRKDALNVFFTTEATDYIKKEIPFINYVRDRKVADVYIISTQEITGSGGSVSTFFIVGQGKYTGMADTVKCNISPDETTDIKRAKEVKGLKMGLVRYVQKTPLSQFMDINFSEPLSETVSSDKWNSWVYAVNLYAYVYGQSTYNINYLSGSLSANRITEKSKFESRLGLDIETDNIKYEEPGFDTTYVSIYKQKSGYLSYVRSINNHWSAGGSMNVLSFTYSKL